MGKSFDAEDSLQAIRNLFALSLDAQRSIRESASAMAAALSYASAYNSQDIADAAATALRNLSESIGFETSQATSALTEAVRAMSHYVCIQGLGPIELRATEDTKESKKTFFQKIEAAASKYQVSLSLLLTILSLLISLISSSPMSTNDIEELKEMHRQELKYDEIHSEQNKEIIRILTEIRDANRNSRDELKDLLDDLQDSIEIVCKTADLAVNIPDQPDDSNNIGSQEPLVDREEQYIERQNETEPSEPPK